MPLAPRIKSGLLIPFPQKIEAIRFLVLFNKAKTAINIIHLKLALKKCALFKCIEIKI